MTDSNRNGGHLSVHKDSCGTHVDPVLKSNIINIFIVLSLALLHIFQLSFTLVQAAMGSLVHCMQHMGYNFETSIVQITLDEYLSTLNTVLSFNNLRL